MKEHKRKVNITIDEDIHLKLETLKLELRKSGQIGTHITMSNMIDHLFDNYENPSCSEVIREVEVKPTIITMSDVTHSSLLDRIGQEMGFIDLDGNSEFRKPYKRVLHVLSEIWSDWRNQNQNQQKKHALR